MTNSKDLQNNDELKDLCGEAGITIALTVKNKPVISQYLVSHDVFTKRKVLFDQLRKGLRLLGVAQEMSKYPAVYKPFFVPHCLTAVDVIETLRFEKDGNHLVSKNLVKFLTESDSATLEKFTMFTMASKVILPATKLTVLVTEEDGFSALTCFSKFKMPESLLDYEEFKLQLNSAMVSGKKSFTMM